MLENSTLLHLYLKKSNIKREQNHDESDFTLYCLKVISLNNEGKREQTEGE